jgi:hypothetical protein
LAQKLMYQYTCEAKINMVFITEPYQQQTYWYKDDKGDASLRVTLLRGKHPVESTVTIRNRLTFVSATYSALEGIVPTMSN